MSATIPTKHPRTIFARVTAQIGADKVRFELHKDGIHIRKKHSRRVHVMTFVTAYDLSQGQLPLPI